MSMTEALLHKRLAETPEMEPCDGVKLLEEALRWNAPLKTVVLSECVDAPTLPSGVRAAQGFGQRALPCARRCAGPRQRGHHPAHGGRV